MNPVVHRLALLALVLSQTAAAQIAATDIGSRRELWVDGFLADHLGGRAELRLHHPIPQEVVIVFDRPWEGNATCYASVFQDNGIYRMYYRAWTIAVIHGQANDHAIPQVICYAESKDGTHWERPSLGLHEFRGSKDNNIVFVGETFNGAKLIPGNEAVFRDENPAVSPDARYKTMRTGSKVGLFAFKSPDGLHWSAMSAEPVIVDHTRNAFDSQQCAFWDTVRKEYRVYWRFYDRTTGGRSIRTSSWKDFLHWENRENLAYMDSPPEELYENCVKPYYRAPQILIGFPVRYVERGWSDSMRALPDLENREVRAGHQALSDEERRESEVAGSPKAMNNGLRATTVHERYGTALTEGLVMASRDGVRFKRWNEAFVRPGIERTGTWNYGQCYLGWHAVETRSALEGAPNELSIYSSESYWIGEASRLRRYTLRLDGFVSVQAPLSGGEVVTKPVVFSGKQLDLNFSTSAAGSVQVEIQGGDGHALPGFSLEDCPPLFGDSISRPVTWKNGADVGPLVGRPVRLRFVLRDADVYAFQFTGAER